jgi:hypothetical protein
MNDTKPVGARLAREAFKAEAPIFGAFSDI